MILLYPFIVSFQPSSIFRSWTLGINEHLIWVFSNLLWISLPWPFQVSSGSLLKQAIKYGLARSFTIQPSVLSLTLPGLSYYPLSCFEIQCLALSTSFYLLLNLKKNCHISQPFFPPGLKKQMYHGFVYWHNYIKGRCTFRTTYIFQRSHYRFVSWCRHDFSTRDRFRAGSCSIHVSWKLGGYAECPVLCGGPKKIALDPKA